MAYASAADLIDRFGEPELVQLTDTTQSGVVDAGRLALELDSASGQMDMYLGARNPLPLTSITQGQASELTRLCCDIARYRLWNDRASDEVRIRYQDAIGVLEMIAKGTLPLQTTEQASDPAPGTAVGAFSRAFSDSVWESYLP